MLKVTSPGRNIVVEIDSTGRLTVEREGERVLDPSPYGVPTPYGLFPDEFELDTAEERKVTRVYELRHGKQSEVHHRATERLCTFEANEGIVELQVRVAEDGVAYRYKIRGDRDKYLLSGDVSGFRFPATAVAWMSDYQTNHEGHSRQLPVTALDGEYNMPGLFRVDETWTLICEAGVDGSWMASHLVDTGDDRPGVDLEFPDSRPASQVWAHEPVVTPWRIAIVGDLNTIVESTLPTDLVDGPRATPDHVDWDWVDPGRAAWSWWSSESNDKNLDGQKEYVDYAAELGWEWMLVDAGWDDEWMPELVEYANERGINVEIWSHYVDLDTESKRENRFSTWKRWGVSGVKVDFMNSDDQGRLRFYDDLAADAARYELAVNLHGSVVPTGLRKRWPHVMTYEGVRGAEYYKWTTNTSEHNAILPFTRNVVGPMDYTPVTFSAERRTTSLGHELALSVVYESGIQHYADAIDVYGSHPAAETVLEAVPVAWDESKFLRGYPGSEAMIARRQGKDWFVGCITAGSPRTVEVPLEFLDNETIAVVTTDTDDGDELIEYEQTVGPDVTLTVSIVQNGGFVIRL